MPELPEVENIRTIIGYPNEMTKKEYLEGQGKEYTTNQISKSLLIC